MEEQRTLPDGTVANVLVPRLYVMVREDGINGTGGLIAANDLQLELRGDLTNSGNVAGHRVNAITADNINNLRGTLQGQDVQLNARNDINNHSGDIRAQDSLLLEADHDINVITTTNTQHSSQGTRVNIDRIAGLYVNSGSLLANAGNNINLTGAAIVNDSLVLDADRLGQTELIAGNDFILNSVQESETQRIVWNGSGETQIAATQVTGTRIATAGDVQLQAGNNLSGNAARIGSHQGSVAIHAGNDLTLAAGQNTYSEQGRASDYQSAAESVRHERVEIDSATGTRLSAGRDLAVSGGALNSAVDVELGARRDTTVSAVVDSDYRYATHRDDRSYGRSTTSTDETLASSVTGGTINSGGNVLINTTRNDDGDIIGAQSGLILPSPDRHPVKRVHYATEVTHDKTSQTQEDIPYPSFGRVQSRSAEAGREDWDQPCCEAVGLA